jgi:hypothetical protein
VSSEGRQQIVVGAVTAGLHAFACVDPVGTVDRGRAAHRIDTLRIALGWIVEVIVKHGPEVVGVLLGVIADDALFAG